MAKRMPIFHQVKVFGGSRKSFCAGLFLLGYIFRILSIFRSGLQIMVFLVIWTMLFRLRVTQVVIKLSLCDKDLVMGVYDVMGAKFLDKKGLKIKDTLKTPKSCL